MMSAFLLEGTVGPRATHGAINGAVALLQRSILHSEALQQCRLLASQGESDLRHQGDNGFGGQASCSSNGSTSGSRDQDFVVGSSTTRFGRITLSTFRQQVLLLLQQRRGIATTAASSAYQFDSNLTRYAKAKVTNRNNFQRWRDSGRDIRVAQEILQESGRAAGEDGSGGRGGRSSSSRRGGNGGRRGAVTASADQNPAAAMAELRSMMNECRDLRELQVIVRECGRDMDASLVCAALHRLPKLKQATPASASPSPLAKRIAESLMLQLQAVASTATLASLAGGLSGLGELGVTPGRPLLEALTDRINKQSPRRVPAILEADARTVSTMLVSVAKLKAASASSRATHRQPLGSKQLGSGSTEGQGAGSGMVAGVEAEAEGDVLAGELWRTLRWAAEVKLLRALGEEPAGVAAVPVGGVEGPEVDDSLPQASLRAICKALALAHDPQHSIWAPAARLTVRHVSELQPAVAASVLRSYAVAGGSAEDGGLEGLVAAVWGALGGPQQLAQVDAAVLLDLLYGANRLAATASLETAAVLSSKMVRPLCDAVAPRVPSMSSADIAVLATGLAQSYGKAVAARATEEDAAAAAAAGKGAAVVRAAPPLSYGALPRLLADALLLRGLESFGAKGFYSVALALGLLGHTDGAFWSTLTAAALPEVPRMDSASLSRLLGAFSAAGAAAAAAPPAPPAPPPTFLSERAAAGAAPAAILPSGELVAAAHSRAATLLDAPPPSVAGAGAGGLYGRDLYHVLRCLAEWPLPDGGAATLARLADRLAVAAPDSEEGRPLAAATPGAREQIVSGLRGAGLGEHALVTSLAGGSS